ncbi:MAG: sigma-70 family RNA polymerase sigma factor [Gemmatimonadota bacterium]
MEPTQDRVRRAQEGDDVAFDRLVRDVYPHVYRWALMQTGAPDDAEDVAQTALMRMHLHLADFRRDSRFTTWLYRIVRTAASDWRRSHRRRRAREQRYGSELPQAHTPSPSGVRTHRALAAVEDALRGLPVRQHEVFDLVELQGIAHADVAELLALAPATVRVHLLRARRSIRTRLLERRADLKEDWT